MTERYVPIPKEDTYVLIRHAQTGDEAAKALLVEQNTGLVKKIAMKFTCSEYETEDLVQIGYVGLLKAIDKFDAGYGVMFSTYAVPVIMGEMKRFFRDNGKIKVSRGLKSEIYTLNQIHDDLSSKLGRTPRISQLAKAMGIDEEHVVEIMEARDSLYNISSLDQQVIETEYELIKHEGSPESKLDWMMMKSELSRLENKEKQVILLRYFRDMTQQEIANIMHVSQVQISRIEKKALSKMRKKLAECVE